MNSKQLLQYQPNYYKTSCIMENANYANALELTSLIENIAETEHQFFLDTADKSLNRWEWELGLKTYETQDLYIRRAKILCKLQGQGTTTVKMIQGIAENFSGDKVEVLEHFSEYYFTLKMMCRNGMPKSIQELIYAIEEIKPCHLGMAFLYAYETEKPAPLYIGNCCTVAVQAVIEPYMAGDYITGNTLYLYSAISCGISGSIG